MKSNLNLVGTARANSLPSSGLEVGPALIRLIAWAALLLAICAPLLPTAVPVAWHPPLALGAAGVLGVLLGELLVALYHLVRSSLPASAARYYRVRTLRPADSRSARTQPLAMSEGFAALIAKPEDWLGLCYSATPDHPAQFGLLCPDEPAAQAALAALFAAHDPHGSLAAAPDPMQAALALGGIVAQRDLRLALPAEYPLLALYANDDSLLASLLSALQPIPGIAWIGVQLSLRQAPAPTLRLWQRMAARAHSLPAFSHALRERVAHPVLTVGLRVVIISTGTSRAERRAVRHAMQIVLRMLRRPCLPSPRGVQRLVALPSATRRATASANVLLRRPRPLPPPPWLLPLPIWAADPILGISEVAALWHLPTSDLGALVEWQPNLPLPAPAPLLAPPSAQRLILGREAQFPHRPITMSIDDLRRVLHLTAGMGAGKSRTLAALAQQLIPHGFVLLDGKGDDAGGSLVQVVRTLIPIAAAERLVLFDPLDREWPIGLNPLAYTGDRQRTIGALLALLARLDPGWDAAPGMQEFARMAARLVMETVPQPTLAEVKAVLEHESFRTTLLARCADREVAFFWSEGLARMSEAQRSSMIALVRRLNNLLADETLRLMLCQAKPALNLTQALDRGQIVLMSLPHMRLGGNANLVGALLLQAIVAAAVQRPGDAQSRTTIPLIIDEIQAFISPEGSEDLRIALTQLRGFGIAGIYAHQSLAQLGPLRDEMLINSASRLILRTGEPDASAYAHLYPGSGLRPTDIANQVPEQHQYAVLNGLLCSLQPLAWPLPPREEPAPFHGMPWQFTLPNAEPALRNLDRALVRLIYRPATATTIDALAALPPAEWALLLARWRAIAEHQRALIVRYPGAVLADGDEPALLTRQRWLSRLAWAQPRLLAAVAYARRSI